MRTCALFFIALAASAQGPNFFSLQQEAELGARMAEAELKKSTPIAHDDVREYVQRLGARISAEMLAVPDASGKYSFARCKFAVIVEDSLEKTHEPTTLPGGYIIVSEHLILAAQDEAEFAGMLAHAIAHASARHATRMLTQAYIAEHKDYVPNSDAMRFARESDAMFQIRRDFEREADDVAIRATAAAGFDPAAFARFIGRTGDRRRAAKIENVIGTLPARSYSSSSEFLSIQKELRGQ